MAKTSALWLRQNLRNIADELIYECGAVTLTALKDTYDAKYGLSISESYIRGMLTSEGYELDQDLLGGWYARHNKISPKIVDR